LEANAECRRWRLRNPHVLGEWRVIYVAKFADAIYVLHAFQKKTQQTRMEDIALATARYKQPKESTK
jgi:phage-related protein